VQFCKWAEFRQFMNRHIALVFGQPSPLVGAIFPIYAIGAALALQPFGNLVGLLARCLSPVKGHSQWASTPTRISADPQCAHHNRMIIRQRVTLPFHLFAREKV